jgi:hypothetical protein
MKNAIKIPHAEYQIDETSNPGRKTLRVFTKLSEKPGTPGFDPDAKLEMEKVIAKMLRSEDNLFGCDDYIVHWHTAQS